MVETQQLVVVFHHGVFRRPVIIPDNVFHTACVSIFDQRVEHGEFHVAFQDPAAHQPEVHMQLITLMVSDQDRNQAVVAEFVGQSSV